ARIVPARPASSWRRHLLLQPGVRPGHERGRPGGAAAPTFAPKPKRRPARRARARLLRRGVRADRDAVGVGSGPGSRSFRDRRATPTGSGALAEIPARP